MIYASEMKRLALLAILAAACGGKPSSTSTTPPSGADPKEVAPPAGMAFKDMNADQRVAFMKLSVMPEMKKMFQEFDGKQFADFTCKTCHGKGAEDGSFDMPNADIKVLPDEAHFPDYMKDPKVNTWVMFMGGKVKPAMAKLLMVPEFNWETKTGEFSCGACHMIEGMPAAGHHHDHDHH